MKKTLALIMAFALCSAPGFTVVAQADASENSSYASSVTDSGTLGKNISYELLNTGLLTIKGSGKTDDYENTPFSEPEKITAVIIENDENGGIEYIGNRIFESCSNLYGIDIPDTVTEIGEYAFDGCSSLKEIIIPDSVRRIGQYAFHNCSALRYAELGKGLEKVGKGSAEFLIFNGCYNLEELTIPALITDSDDNPDNETGQIYKLMDNSSVFSSSMISISYGAMSRYSLKKITVKSGETICPYAFAGLNVKEFILPDTLTNISKYSFYRCESLSEITIPESVTEIGECAFNECPVLADITLWNNIKKFGDDAFTTNFRTNPDVYFHGTREEWKAMNTSWAFSGETVHFIDESQESDSDKKPDSSDSAVKTEGSLGKDIRYSFYENGCLTISGSGRMDDFESCPFDFSSEIISVSFDPESAVENIGSCTFLKCSAIKYAELPDGLKEIGNSAFMNCSALKEITVPDSVTCIRESAFRECTGMTKAVLGEGLRYVGTGSAEFDILKNCTSLNELTVPSLVTGPDEYTKNDDGTKTRTSEYGQMIKLFHSETEISPGSYSSAGANYHLKKITVSSGTEIHPYAFCCLKFNDLILPDTISVIAEKAFSNCVILKSVDISNAVTIGDEAFRSCESLKKIDIGENLESVGKNAFSFTYPDYIFYHGTEEKWNSFMSGKKESPFRQNALRFIVPSEFIMTVGTSVTSPSLLESGRGCGDVNGNDITDITDLTCLSLYLIRDYNLTDGGKVYSDITMDGTVDMADLAALKMILMKKV